MKCPGQDTQYWTAGSIFEAKCPECGAMVEFFKDDTSRKCPKCGHRFVNPRMDFGCAAYCQYAEQCLGDLPPELMAQKENLLKDLVAVAVKRHYGRDFKRIAHVTRMARYAETVGKTEGANMAVVLSAAYLKDVDAPEAADLPEATAILTRVAPRPELVGEVVAVVKLARADQAPDPGEFLEAAVIHDAESLAHMEEALKKSKEAPPAGGQPEAQLLTPAGREEADRLRQAS
jgi:hypothetical protein